MECVGPQITGKGCHVQSGYEKKTERRPNDLRACVVVISGLQTTGSVMSING